MKLTVTPHHQTPPILQTKKLPATTNTQESVPNTLGWPASTTATNTLLLYYCTKTQESVPNTLGWPASDSSGAPAAEPFPLSDGFHQMLASNEAAVRAIKVVVVVVVVVLVVALSDGFHAMLASNEAAVSFRGSRVEWSGVEWYYSIQ